MDSLQVSEGKKKFDPTSMPTTYPIIGMNLNIPNIIGAIMGVGSLRPLYEAKAIFDRIPGPSLYESFKKDPIPSPS
jgi:hypothetical protein